MELTWYQEKKTEFILFSLLQFGLFLYMLAIPVLFFVGTGLIIYALVKIHKQFMNRARYRVFFTYIFVAIGVGVVIGLLASITAGISGIVSGNVAEQMWVQVVMGAVLSLFQMWLFRSLMAQETVSLFYPKDIKFLGVIIGVQIISTSFLPVILSFVIGVISTLVVIEYLYREHKEKSA